ncbi:peptidoglycan DD-metalloendopeptidase family protein [Hoeflea olei]|uniref:LysM domain-containing protein n=1 Tax=Hoeflea olei TaxID=1480615 RepID=A0A1C1YZK6_9HYPH|nr:peptidoglycan DD-metalloendopeptidase family protein [Hoeflea olei]OCW58859.1 hypothetical protein AWJ14_21000 [Hoeflea olei]
MTASVPAPSASRLAPLADIGGSGGLPAQNGGYPAAPGSVSQAYPGDYRSASVPAYDPTATGSVPGSAARASASSSGLINSGSNSQPVVARQALAAPQPALAAPSTPRRQGDVAQAPQQPFPERPARPAAGVEAKPAYAANAPAITPDPIVTGTASQGNGWTTAGATRITLGEGETIYNLSKRYGVPANEIMKANGIDDASRVSAGRQLLIPVYVYSRQAPVSAPDNNPMTRSSRSGTGLLGEAKQDQLPVPAPAPRQDVAVLPTVPSPRNPRTDNASPQALTANADNAAPKGSAEGTYTVKSGDTLTRIANQHGVSVDALKAVNSLSNTNIRIGQTLTIPAAGAPAVDRTTRTASVPAAEQPKPYTPPASAKTDSVAAKAKSETASIAPASTGIDKFRWPARGQVITGFAKTENGKRNDGIDISLPTGTPIKAAENGVVIYSGDGLQEYGKTVLLRHDDGLVTVYAHAESLNVSRGDKVVRGQVIASSGMTGIAKTPRLHFEVRKNATPVDPAKYLE